jgi:hypothetical protein
MRKTDIAQWKCRYRLEKRHGDIDACLTPEGRLAFLLNTVPYEVIEGEGNCLLNTGIDEMWDLIVGDSANHFSSTKATIGVGDSATAAAATQTDLLAASNKDYHAMEATYPTSTTQKVTFKASFGSGHAAYAWAEWVVKQSDSAICLNRKVDALGTKSSGTWTLEVTITLS